MKNKLKSDEEYLDKQFPKRDKRRGEAMVLLALARIQGREENKEDKIIARQCLHFKGYNCDNLDCLNKECPLHKSIPEHIKKELGK